MNLLISAGEASGDLHGARLLAALKRRRPGLTAFGMGGGRLESAGLERVVRSEALSVVGISEVFEKLPQLARAIRLLRDAARRSRPDAAILIDFPDFHGWLARTLHREGVPLVYYVSPQVWAWRSGRARGIARRARRIITLFPFEAEIYRRLGADAVWAGHPLVDDVHEGLEELAPGRPHPERRSLVLMPGSRSGEVRRHWEPMAEAAAALAPRFDLEVVVIRAPGLPDALFPEGSTRGFRFVSGNRYSHLAAADLAFVASGTATLEAALCGTPMIVVYKTSAASFAIGKRLIRVPWISLVNIVAEEEVVPELLQEQVNATRLERMGASLLDDPAGLAKMRAAFGRVEVRLGPPGASERAADAVLDALEPEARSRSAAR
jgi:lipid-A-disaccharide synthase